MMSESILKSVVQHLISALYFSEGTKISEGNVVDSRHVMWLEYESGMSKLIAVKMSYAASIPSLFLRDVF